MHVSGSIASLSFRHSCSFCCSSRRLRHWQTTPDAEAKRSFLEPCAFVNAEQGYCQIVPIQLQYASAAMSCCNQFSAYKIKQSNSPSSGSQERFISRPVLKNNYGDQDMAHSKLPSTHFVSKFNYAFTIHLLVFEYRDTEDF